MTEFLLSHYGELRFLHIAAALASGAGFALRGAWMLVDSPRLGARWVRVVPHAVDTLLLASALALVFASGQSPGALPWLNAKIVALLAYIGCGLFALRRGRSDRRHGCACPLADGCAGMSFPLGFIQCVGVCVVSSYATAQARSIRGMRR